MGRAAPGILCAALAWIACEAGEPERIAGEPAPSRREEALSEIEAPVSYAEDLPSLRRRGVLRILVQRRSEAWLPRNGSPLDADRARAADLARELGLEPRFESVERFEELLPALAAGWGDLVVENLTATAARREQVAFSAPVDLVREQLVTRADDEGLAAPADLAGRTVAVQRSSSFWASAQALAEQQPALRVEAAPEELDTDALLDGVASGRFDLTIMDSNLMRASARWRDDLRVAFDLPGEQAIAWAMRRDAPRLKQAVDAYLARTRRREAAGGGVHTEDLPGLKERGVLRVLTRNSSATYFISRGRLVGFEYDLARRFADHLGLRIEMVVPPSHDDLFPWLRDGRGDVIAAGLTILPGRAEKEGAAFSRMMQEVRETVVARRDGERPVPESVDDLAGRSFAVRRSSSYWRTLEGMREAGLGIELVAAPESLETEEIIDRVADGRYDLTLADSHILAVERSWRDDVVPAFRVGDLVAHGWAVRKDSPELLAAIDTFFDREYRGLFYNVTRNKYFGSTKKIREHHAERPRRTGSISPYDDIVKPLTPPLGLDWRLVIAQMYQESRFDPKARSFAGARGLLQVMPRTAREFGYTRLEDPETGIRAGLEYLAWVRKRFDPDLPSADRTWMALAAYNVGAGHVRDAQRLAVEHGLDPDRWFGHVEKALLLKQKPEYHRKTRFGYARASEPVAYVRSIRDRYQAYIQAQAMPDRTP